MALLHRKEKQLEKVFPNVLISGGEEERLGYPPQHPLLPPIIPNPSSQLSLSPFYLHRSLSAGFPLLLHLYLHCFFACFRLLSSCLNISSFYSGVWKSLVSMLDCQHRGWGIEFLAKAETRFKNFGPFLFLLLAYLLYPLSSSSSSCLLFLLIFPPFSSSFFLFLLPSSLPWSSSPHPPTFLIFPILLSSPPSSSSPPPV